MDDDVSIDELREAVEHMHGVPARYVETVEVDERLRPRPSHPSALMTTKGSGASS
jgi:hypothetical protein